MEEYNYQVNVIELLCKNIFWWGVISLLESTPFTEEWKFFNSFFGVILLVLIEIVILGSSVKEIK